MKKLILTAALMILVQGVQAAEYFLKPGDAPYSNGQDTVYCTQGGRSEAEVCTCVDNFGSERAEVSPGRDCAKMNLQIKACRLLPAPIQCKCIDSFGSERGLAVGRGMVEQCARLKALPRKCTSVP